MTIEVGMLIAIATFALGYLSHTRTKSKDVEKDAAERAIVSTKLNSIDTGVRDIQVQMRSTDKKIDDLNERVTRNEESSKQAHKRIDKLERVECK